MGDRMGIAPFTMLAVIYIGILVYGIVGFILGPISYCIIKALVLYLKSILEHDSLDFSLIICIIRLRMKRGCNVIERGLLWQKIRN